MSFIGNAPAAIPTSFQAVQADSFNGNGSTTNFTLSRQITNLYDIEVLVDNVQQSPYDGSYSVNGTTITFSSAPGSGTNNIYIVYRDHPITSIQPKGDLTLEANLNVDGTVYANATLARDGGSDATINGVTPTSDNLMGRNRLINGDMRIDQRNAGASVSADGAFPVDRFRQNMVGGGVLTSNRSTTAPTGFTNSVLVTVSTADASIAAGDYYNFSQQVEGFNAADFGFGSASSQTVTLSFWVRSSLTGTFAGCLSNSAANRSYTFTYSISSANAWEQKTVTIAGDTSGTWLTDNGIGIRVVFDLGSGSDSQGTAGSWQSGFKSATSGAVKLISTLNATWYITGVQLEAGSVATSFERRMYPQELQLCQRYFFKKQSEAVDALQLPAFYNGSTSNSWITYFYPVEMRALPTFANPSNFYGSSPYSVNPGIRNVAMRWLVGTDYMQGVTTFDLSAEL